MKKIGVIGLGLIGGSMAIDLEEKVLLPRYWVWKTIL